MNLLHELRDWIEHLFAHFSHGTLPPVPPPGQPVTLPPLPHSDPPQVVVTPPAGGVHEPAPTPAPAPVAPPPVAAPVDSAYPVDGQYSYADDNGLIAIKAIDDVGIAHLAKRYGSQSVIDDPAKFKLSDAAKRKLQANLNDAYIHVAAPAFVSNYTLDGTGLYVVFEQSEGGPAGTMVQGVLVADALTFPGDSYDPVAGHLLWKAPRLSDIPQFLDNCRKSGQWPVIDHSQPPSVSGLPLPG